MKNKGEIVSLRGFAAVDGWIFEKVWQGRDDWGDGYQPVRWYVGQSRFGVWGDSFQVEGRVGGKDSEYHWGNFVGGPVELFHLGECNSLRESREMTFLGSAATHNGSKVAFPGSRYAAAASSRRVAAEAGIGDSRKVKQTPTKIKRIVFEVLLRIKLKLIFSLDPCGSQSEIRTGRYLPKGFGLTGDRLQNSNHFPSFALHTVSISLPASFFPIDGVDSCNSGRVNPTETLIQRGGQHVVDFITYTAQKKRDAVR